MSGSGVVHAQTATPWGIEARPVEVQVDVRDGPPKLEILGLSASSGRACRQRVRAALENCGYELPPRSIVVHLAPADLRKDDSHLDLGVALALLVALRQVPREAMDGRLPCGELGLDGALRPVRGGLAMAELACEMSLREVLLPPRSAREAASLGAVPVVGPRNLMEGVEHLRGGRLLEPVPGASEARPWAAEPTADLVEIRGQESAKRALEIAAAGGHNLLLIGPRGVGKTMLGRCLPGLLPPLSRAESLAVTKIHSLAADEPPAGRLTRRPFRSPHSSITTAGLVGGGSIPKPGEVSLAHHGVLWLDELSRFRRETLEALRQPLEEGVIDLVRTRARFRFPARFVLVAAMTCPGGRQERVSRPLLDRIDLHVEMPAVTLGELDAAPAEPSETVAARVAAARRVQRERFGDEVESPVNAAMGPAEVRRFCGLDERGRRLLDSAYERLGLSARGLHRLLKVARTLADLAGKSEIQAGHVAEAIQYRSSTRQVEAEGGPR